ncbi:hypothetical protein HRbin08_01118 [bacterium HR08]|nr:hypothetical protein HRbin08_01118 [bacterium HR08]
MREAALLDQDGLPLDPLQARGHGISLEIAHPNALAREGGDLPILQEEDIARVVEQSEHVRGDEVFVATDANDDRWPLSNGHNGLRHIRRDDGQGEDAGHLSERRAHGPLQAQARIRFARRWLAQMRFDQMRDDLGVGLRPKRMPLRQKPPLQRQIVLQDPVVDDGQTSRAITMRMRVLHGRPPVRGPARVSDPVGPIEGVEADQLLQVPQLARRAAHL